MTKELANPFAHIIAAAEKLPATTGRCEEQTRRFHDCTDTVVVLADCSGSMAEAAGTEKKEALLRQALIHVLPSLPTARLYGFHSIPVPVSIPEQLPSATGSTALHLALEAAQREKPIRTLVISDGHPDSEDAAMQAASSLTGRIDVLYIGPDGDAAAIAFLRRLAMHGGGTIHTHDLVRLRTSLLPSLHTALLLPAPGGGR